MNALTTLPSTCDAIGSTSTPSVAEEMRGHPRPGRRATGRAQRARNRRPSTLTRDLVVAQRAGDTADPEFHVRGPPRELLPEDDVRDRQSSVRLQYPEGFTEHRIFVRRRIDDAIGDDHGDPGPGAECFDLAFEKFDVGDPAWVGSPGPGPAFRRSCPGRTPFPRDRRAWRRARHRCRRRNRGRALSDRVARSMSAVGFPQPRETAIGIGRNPQSDLGG